jgi:hypothetical protein
VARQLPCVEEPTRRYAVRPFMLDNLRFAVRLLLKNPGYTLAVVVTLAVGIGANTTVFSFADSLWSRSHAFPDLDRLVAISGSTTHLDSGADSQPTGVSPADFRDWRTEAISLEQLAAWSGWLADLSGEGEPERLTACFVTANFFATLGVRPALGRLFPADANEPGVRQRGHHQPRLVADEDSGAIPTSSAARSNSPRILHRGRDHA